MIQELNMTLDEAINELTQSCTDLKEVVELLQKENAFLTDTIEKHNLGNIKSERRALLSENEQCKRKAEAAIRKAKQIETEYESKISEANSILADVKKKQSDIDSYIEKEVENKLKDIRKEYENYKIQKDKEIHEKELA